MYDVYKVIFLFCDYQSRCQLSKCSKMLNEIFYESIDYSVSWSFEYACLRSQYKLIKLFIEHNHKIDNVILRSVHLNFETTKYLLSFNEESYDTNSNYYKAIKKILINDIDHLKSCY